MTASCLCVSKTVLRPELSKTGRCVLEFRVAGSHRLCSVARDGVSVVLNLTLALVGNVICLSAFDGCSYSTQRDETGQAHDTEVHVREGREWHYGKVESVDSATGKIFVKLDNFGAEAESRLYEYWKVVPASCPACQA